MNAAYWLAVFLTGALVGAVGGVAYTLREVARRDAERERLVRRYGR